MNGTYILKTPSEYQAEGKSESIIISKRKYAKPGLSSLFMLLVSGTGQRTYISSLYPTSSGLYNMEKNGIRYVVEIKEDKLFINFQH